MAALGEDEPGFTGKGKDGKTVRCTCKGEARDYTGLP